MWLIYYNKNFCIFAVVKKPSRSTSWEEVE
jgi:hypothetical protein